MGGHSSKGHFQRTQLVTTYKGALENKYDMIKEVGKGAQGTTWLVRSKFNPDEQMVAKETLTKTDEGRQEFLKEFEKMRALEHPNIAKVIELVEGMTPDGTQQLFVISELAPGSDLYKYMQTMMEDRAELSEQWIAAVFKQAMAGVSYLHAQNITHNDLKPDNILVMKGFNKSDPNMIPDVVINDFGCANHVSESIACGDPRYCPPEAWRATILPYLQIPGEEDAPDPKHIQINNKVDVWSMGATLFELLSGGKLPFLYKPCRLQEFCNSIKDTGGPFHEMKNGVLAPDAVKVRTHCPNCSEEVCDLIKMMLEKDVNKRPLARTVLEHNWFNIEGMPLDASTKQMLHLRTSKGVAHSILMNALALKVHRDHYDECKAIFNEADEDHSGTIDQAEFVKAATKLKLLGRGTDVNLSSTGSEITISTKEASKWFESIDIDKTGDINFNEFLAMSFDWSKLSAKELEGNLKKLFADLDADGNGLIDINELRATFQGVVEDEEIDILMSTCSRNGVELSLDEVKSFLFDEGSNRSYTDHMQKVVTHKAKKRKEAIEENCCVSGVCVCLSAILIWKCWLTPGL